MTDRDSKATFKIRLVASAPASREKGLMHAEPLEPDEVAFFVFPRSDRYAFWNKNVSFDLTLAYLDEEGRIVHFADLPAMSERFVRSDSPARYVVEAPAGAWERLGVHLGDIVTYRDHALRVAEGSDARKKFARVSSR